MSDSTATKTYRYSSLANDMVAGSFSPEEFSHLDHLGVAFELLKHNDFIAAVAIFSSAIRQFTISLGAPDKYNTTVTLSFFALVAERMSGDEQDFSTFLASNKDLLKKNVLGGWYSGEQLNSEFARRCFLMPRKTQASPGSSPVCQEEIA